MIKTPISPQLIRGAADIEATDRGLRIHRLPAWVRRQFPDFRLLAMQSQPSGVRLVMRTSATSVELDTHPSRLTYRAASRPRGRIDAYVNGTLMCSDVLGGGDVTEIDLASGATAQHAGPSHTTVLTGLPAGRNRIEFWLPHNESVDLVELRADAEIHEDETIAPQWVHHGSSISQGSNASAPSEVWPAVAARQAGVELRNLGFGGNALVDPFVARVIRDAPADYISVKLGINVVNLDGMRLRTFVPAVHGFLDTIRDGHPETPVVLMSPTFCGIHEDTPGPGAFDPATLGTDHVQFVATGDPDDTESGKLTLQVIRRELETLVERRADENLHYLDGLALYGPDDAAQLPLTDGLHPCPATHRSIGERFAAHAFADGGPFT